MLNEERTNVFSFQITSKGKISINSKIVIIQKFLSISQFINQKKTQNHNKKAEKNLWWFVEINMQKL